MRIAILSSENLFREGLLAIIKARTNIGVTAVEGPIRQAIKGGKLPSGSLLIIDLRDVPEGDLDFLEGVQAFGSVRTIFIVDGEVAKDFPLREAVSRSATADEFIRAVRSFAHKSEVREHGAPRRGRPRQETNSLPLAKRQYEIVEHMAAGMSNLQIADEMGIKEQTVKNVVTTIMKRLGCRNRHEVIGMLKKSR